MTDILDQQRLGQPPAKEDFSQGIWERDVTDSINSLPPTSVFSQTTPNSTVTGQEGTIGVNLNPNAIGLWFKSSGNTNIGWTNISYPLTDTVWDDARVPAQAAGRRGNIDPDWEVFTDNIYEQAFSSSATEELFFNLQMPHKWKLGTNINPHVHWAPSTTDTGSVRWAVEYTIANINGTFGSASTVAGTDAGDGTALKHQYADLGDIDMTAYTDPGDVSTMLCCRLIRWVSHADDDYADDAFLLEIDFHYEIDTLGSAEENSK